MGSEGWWLLMGQAVEPTEITRAAVRRAVARTSPASVVAASRRDEDDDGFLVRHGRWTARRALAELPETPRTTVEVFDGSLVVTPRRSLRHQAVVLELGIALKRVARAAGYGTHPQLKVVVGDELVSPDLTVSTQLGEETTCVGSDDAVLVADVTLSGDRLGDRFDRPRVYAAGRIGHYLRLDLSGAEPALSLFELTGEEYRPVALASGGARFAMRRPFPFDLDPTSLGGEPLASAAAGVPPQRGVRLDGRS